MDGWDIRNIFTGTSLAVLGLLLLALAGLGIIHASFRGAIAV